MYIEYPPDIITLEDISVAKKETIIKRREEGLCIQCGANARGKSRCSVCAVQAKANRQKIEQKRKDNKLCGICGKNPSRSNAQSCEDCRYKPSKGSQNRYYRNKATGVCRTCSQPLEDYKSRCNKCAAAFRIYQLDRINKRRAKNLCIYCPNVSRVGESTCERCITKAYSLKADILNRYGGPVCVGCKETEFLLLQMDHINGGGNKHAKLIGGQIRLYPWLKANNYPEGFRVLCGSCNIRASRKVIFPCERIDNICSEFIPKNKSTWRLKLKILENYGGPVCVGCGETELIVLQIDHINGGGNKHRKDIGGCRNTYRWLRDNNFPPGFRVLCVNCNIRATRKLPFPNQP